jgi:Cdc6-like AAA superfamily ATPase
MDYIMSPIVTAMIRGGICFIDEIAKIRPRALAPLASLLDERRYIDSNILGERIIAHPGFRLVGATNTIDLHQNQLPDFIQSRMRPVISISFPGREEIDAIVASRFKGLRTGDSTLLDLYWDLWKERHGDRPPAPRDSLYIFGYARKLADFESAGRKEPLALDGPSEAGPITEDHLTRAMDTFHESLTGSGG